MKLKVGKFRKQLPDIPSSEWNLRYKVSDFNSNSSCQPFRQSESIPTLCVHMHYTGTHACGETHTKKYINVTNCVWRSIVVRYWVGFAVSQKLHVEPRCLRTLSRKAQAPNAFRHGCDDNTCPAALHWWCKSSRE